MASATRRTLRYEVVPEGGAPRGGQRGLRRALPYVIGSLVLTLGAAALVADRRRRAASKQRAARASTSFIGMEEEGLEVSLSQIARFVAQEYLWSEKVRNLSKGEAPPFRPSEYLEQEGAQIGTGEPLRLYAVGSSNVVWMTWIHQLHLHLKRLGYALPVVPTTVKSDPMKLATCDDTKYFEQLETARLGKVGWNSWDFAFDDWSDCNSEGYRNISNHWVRCEHGVGCTEGREPHVRVSDIAADAGGSNVTLVATWYNDHKQPFTKVPFSCFKGERIQSENTSFVAIPDLLRLIRAIHGENPDVWVLVMGEYPMTSNFGVMDSSVGWVRILNARVKAAVEQEPRTLFVDYHVPAGVEMYQKANYGHPNCRGSKIMAHAIIDRLYAAKVLSRNIKLENPARNAANPECGGLRSGACHASALCWVDPEDMRCKPYGVGSPHPHVIRS